jgi:hypothetical protein
MTITIDPRNKIIELVIPEEEWPDIQLCCICQKRADKKITTYGAPDGIPRVSRYCNFCINIQLPQFQILPKFTSKIVSSFYTFCTLILMRQCCLSNLSVPYREYSFA